MTTVPWDNPSLAANGEAIKDNFAAWFGDSKVRDRSGNPLMVYHGTDADFLQFAGGDVGFHFGPLAAAESRLEHTRSDRTLTVEAEATSAEHIMPIYLSIKNPLRLPDAGDWNIPDVVARVVGDVLLDDDELAAAYEQAADACPGEDFRAVFELMGYDGIVYHNVAEGGGDSFIAFRPEQIKSAIGNAGLYLANSPDLTDQAAAQSLKQAQAAREILEPLVAKRAVLHA